MFARFYQLLSDSVSGVSEIGNRVCQFASLAQSFRKREAVTYAARLLAQLPSKQFQLKGQYYAAWAELPRTESQRHLFEEVFDHCPDYRGKAMLSLGGLEATLGNYGLEMDFFRESLKLDIALHEKVQALKGIAVVKAKEGYHWQALADLEKLLPFVPHLAGHVGGDVLNSYAVELAEISRINEALDVARSVLKHPLAAYYREWQETPIAIAARCASRSVVYYHFVGCGNVVPLLARQIDSGARAKETTRPGDLLPFKPKLEKQPQEEQYDDLLVDTITRLGLEKPDRETLLKIRRMLDDNASTA